MNELVTIRKNIFYTKNKEGEMIKHNELIFVVRKPNYVYKGEAITVENELQDLRVTVSASLTDTVLDMLKKILEATEEDLN